MMKLVAVLFGLFIISQASQVNADQQNDTLIADNQSHQDFSVEQNTDDLEKFVINHLVPLYNHIKASPHLNITIKAILGFILVSICIRVCLNIITGKDQDKDLIREIRELKKQFNALKEEKAKTQDDSSIEEIKNELKSITKTLADNEGVMKEKEKLNSSALDFQNEVVDSHKAIWNELRALKRFVSHRKPAGIKIPPKEKPSVTFCQSAASETTQPELKSSLLACVTRDTQKSSTEISALPKSSFAKGRKFHQSPESAQVGSAETQMEPDSGIPRQDESPSAPEAQTPLTQLIKNATNTLSATIFDDSPIKGDVNLTLKPLTKRLTIMSSKKIVANSPRPLIPQSVFN